MYRSLLPYRKWETGRREGSVMRWGGTLQIKKKDSGLEWVISSLHVDRVNG